MQEIASSTKPYLDCNTWEPLHYYDDHNFDSESTEPSAAHASEPDEDESPPDPVPDSPVRRGKAAQEEDNEVKEEDDDEITIETYESEEIPEEKPSV